MLGALTTSLGLEMEPHSGGRRAYPAMAETGTLIVAAVPIGQPGDASPRLAAALAGATVIAAGVYFHPSPLEASVAEGVLESS